MLKYMFKNTFLSFLFITVYNYKNKVYICKE